MIRVLLAVAMALPLLSVPAGEPTDWNRYPCPSGEIDVGAVIAKPADPGIIEVILPGMVTCGVPEPGPTFGVAFFVPTEDTGTIYGHELTYPYRSPDGPTTFVLRGGLRRGDVVGLCLMTDLQTRLSCVGITNGQGGVQAGSLPPDHPLVGRPVVYVRQSGPRPGCATCWTISA